VAHATGLRQYLTTEPLLIGETVRGLLSKYVGRGGSQQQQK